jgi:hypothetical protein
LSRSKDLSSVFFASTTRLEVGYFFCVLKGAVILEDASIHAVEE